MVNAGSARLSVDTASVADFTIVRCDHGAFICDVIAHTVVTARWSGDGLWVFLQQGNSYERVFGTATSGTFAKASGSAHFTGSIGGEAFDVQTSSDSIRSRLDHYRELR